MQAATLICLSVVSYSSIGLNFTIVIALRLFTFRSEKCTLMGFDEKVLFTLFQFRKNLIKIFVMEVYHDLRRA